MDYVRENPPPKKTPSGRPTRYQAAIDAAFAEPGEWFKLRGEHHTSNITTLKGHGLLVRSKRGKQTHKHILWICAPVPEKKSK